MLLWYAGLLAQNERNPAEVERLASDLIELSTRQSFALWRAGGEVLRGWARSVSGHTAEGLSRIKDGIEDWWATGAMHCVPYWLALQAEALHLAARTSEALAVIQEAEALAETLEEGAWRSELCRFRGVCLAALGAEEAEIEAAFCDAIRTAKQQKSISLLKRAEVSYADYRSRNATRPGKRGG